MMSTALWSQRKRLCCGYTHRFPLDSMLTVDSMLERFSCPACAAGPTLGVRDHEPMID